MALFLNRSLIWVALTMLDINSFTRLSISSDRPSCFYFFVSSCYYFFSYWTEFLYSVRRYILICFCFLLFSYTWILSSSYSLSRFLFSMKFVSVSFLFLCIIAALTLVYSTFFIMRNYSYKSRLTRFWSLISSLSRLASLLLIWITSMCSSVGWNRVFGKMFILFESPTIERRRLYLLLLLNLESIDWSVSYVLFCPRVFWRPDPCILILGVWYFSLDDSRENSAIIIWFSPYLSMT